MDSKPLMPTGLGVTPDPKELPSRVMRVRVRHLTPQEIAQALIWEKQSESVHNKTE
jgi:hypothetical protein